MSVVSLKSVLMPLAGLAFAASSFGGAARADDDNWVTALECQSLPTTAASGYYIHVYRQETSLINGKAEIYTTQQGTDTTVPPTQTLVDTVAVQQDPNLGSGNEVVSIFKGANFDLESTLLMADDPANNVETSTLAYNGAAGTLNLQLTCY